MSRTILLASALSILLASAGARAQEEKEQKLQCSGPTVTRPQARRGAAGRGAWAARNSGADGVLSFTHCLYFKAGRTTINRIDPKDIYGLPKELDAFDAHMRPHGLGIRVGRPPAGFRVYRDLAFEVRTTAISTGPHPVAFRVPSAPTPEEFKKLWVLYLDEDWMDPGSLIWKGHAYPALDIPPPDFGRRTFTAGIDLISVFSRRAPVGRFVVGTFDPAEYERSPAADIEVRDPVAPAAAKVGESLTFSVTVGNRGPAPASDVVFNHNTGAHEQFVSATASQGQCRKSVNSDSVTVCRLGTIPAGGSVKVSVTVKVGNDPMIEYRGSVPHQTTNRVRARERDPQPDNNSLETQSTTLRP